MLSPAVGEKPGRIDVVVDHVRVPVVGQIVYAEAPRPEVVQQAEPALKMQVHVEVSGQPLGVGVAHQETLLVDDSERKASPILEKIGYVRFTRQEREESGNDGFR